jgi:stage II sporulation protein D
MKIYVDGKAVSHLPELQSIKDIKILKRSEGGNVKEISFTFDNAVIDVIEDSNIRGALKSSKIYRYRFNPITRVSSLPSSFFSVQKVEGNFIIFGGGYGHGVGMSQYGAMVLAKEGIKCRDILSTYYSGIELNTMY